MITYRPTRTRRGASTVEYLLILGALVLVLIVGLAWLPALMRGSYRDAASGMQRDGGPLKVRAIFGEDEPMRDAQR